MSPACTNFQNLVAQLTHEDNLLDYRTAWLLGSSLLFLLGYFMLDASKLPTRPGFNYYTLIEISALFVTAIIFASIIASETEFISIRTQIYSTIPQCPELLLRKLPRVGIGAGLLAPMLLSIIFLFIWALLTFRGWLAASLVATSGVLFSIFFVAIGHGPGLGISIFALLAAALISLLVAVLVGTKSFKTAR